MACCGCCRRIRIKEEKEEREGPVLNLVMALLLFVFMRLMQ
jgi:hypothetical protein